MKTPRTSNSSFEPHFPGFLAAGICTLAALSLLWPLLTGHILFGGDRSDMFIAGYSFRLFGAETFKNTGAIPQWNPYLFSGLPYIAAMHGDIFYPTAWLRWIMPVDLAITLGMVVHLVLAGWLTYIFARALGLSWSGAVTAGVAYELSGIVASQMSPGHDGKLFVSALAPLAFWILLRAIRDGTRWAYGVFAIVVALTVLGHYHMSYFLLIALGLWTLYLSFWDPGRPIDAKPWMSIAYAAVAVVVGVGIAALQLVPFLEYIKYSPRADGGPNTGWAFATSYAFPPREIFSALLPEFNGVLGNYWGQNPIKFHTEYIGVLPLALATLAWGDKTRRRLASALAVGAVLFLLLSFGGYSPLYRLAFDVLPYLNKIRAMGMVFYLVAFPVCLLAGIGLDRVLSASASPRTVVIVAAGFALFGLLGAAGALQVLAESLAIPERMLEVQANAPALRIGAQRLILFAVFGGALLWAAASRRLDSRAATALVIALIVGDLWSVNRQFFTFSPRASTLFRDDAITSHLKKVRLPYRVLDAGNSYGHSILMAYGIPNAIGYHGFELRNYDELGGMDEGWRNLFTPNLLDLLSIRFLILSQAEPVPGYHLVLGPTTTSVGRPALLYERDAIPAYARVMVFVGKAPEGQDVPTLVDPRFPINQVVVYSDTSSVRADPVVRPFPLSAVVANVTAWKPGEMTVSLRGADRSAGHLVVSENWYLDWHADVDGKPGVVRRADHSLLSVDLPVGAKVVRLWFDSAAYARGKIISLVALLLAGLMIAIPLVRSNRER
ncbi:MAG: hypothetical protein ABIT20_21395 [Gemmatimonadaceae bacterium]